MESDRFVCPGCGSESQDPGVCPECQQERVATCPACGNPIVGETIRHDG